MKHLSEDRLVDLAEGSSSGREHLEACPACRERLATMRQMLELLRDDRIPEPSPLFWDHLSGRIASAIDDETMNGQAVNDETIDDATINSERSWVPPRWGWVFAAAGAIVVALIVLPMQRKPEPGTIADRAATSPPTIRDGGDQADDLDWAVFDAGDSWEVVAGLAEDLDFESASDAGISLRPGSVEQAVLMLSAEERRELAVVIQAELSRSRS